MTDAVEWVARCASTYTNKAFREQRDDAWILDNFFDGCAVHLWHVLDSYKFSLNSSSIFELKFLVLNKAHPCTLYFYRPEPMLVSVSSISQPVPV